jgi:iron complex outermembrane recepter protein
MNMRAWASSRRGLVGAFVVLACVAQVCPAEEQTAGSNEPQAAAAADSGLSEIVVTAERRAQRAADVPASITAVSGSTLQELGVTSTDQIANLVPGLTYSNTGPIPVFNVRGITLNDYGLSNESPIALYVDDVYLASPSAVSGQMFDVSRVEVLRGPQGTLFGRNATGGLVQIVSNKPTDVFQADASLQYGSFNQVIAQAALGGPVTDRLRVRVAFNFNRDDGWQENAALGDIRQAKTDELGVRLLADYDISPVLTSETNLHTYVQDNVTPGYYSRGEFDPSGDGSLCATAAILANACVTPFGARDPSPNPRVVYSDIADPPNHVHNHGGSETLKYTSDAYTLTSISAFEYTNKFYMEDSDGSPDPVFQSIAAATRKQYSQEVRLNGATDSLHWVVGGLGFYDQLQNGVATLPQIVPLYGTYGNQNEYSDWTRSFAAYGQADYEFSPAWTLTAGVRFTDETKSLVISDDFAAPTYVDHDSARTDRVTWKAGGQYHIDSEWMIYTSASTGFKSPAFDTTLVVQGGAVAAKPETAINYELGLKGEAFDRRLQFSTAAFYMVYRDMQFITIPPNGNSATSELLNADRANIYGADAEINAAPVHGLTLNLSGTFLHTQLTAPDLYIGQYPVTGAQLAYSPKFSLKGFGRYDWHLATLGTVSPHVDFSHNGTSQSQPILDPLTVIPAYTLIDGGVTYTPPAAHYSIDLLVNNLTNKSYITYAGDFAGYNILQWAKPRTYAIRLATKW